MPLQEDMSRRDQLLDQCRRRLESRSDSYFMENFNALKSSIVDPQGIYNLTDFRELSQRHMDTDQNSFQLELIHGEIWARTLLYTASLHNVVTQVLLDGGDPTTDPLVLDHLAAVNLVALQYGVYYIIEGKSRFSCLLLHDENLRLHVIWGSLPAMPTRYIYGVALSFAGEQRDYAERVALALKNAGARVFYDRFETADLWGKDLYQHLNEVYKTKSRFAVILVSAEYAQKQWPSHELRSMQARALAENCEYILPVRFDDAELPGLNDTTAYLSAKDTKPEDLATIIVKKLAKYTGPSQR